MHRILLVDDEPLCARLTAVILEKHGFISAIANDAVEALTHFSREPFPDLVLMDIDLGKDPDGTEAARQILEITDVPLIFHSSHKESEMIERTERITSYGYVVKNSGDPILLAAIRMAFRMHELRLAEKNNYLALHKSEEKFRKLFMEHTAIKLLVDPENGTIIDANHAAELFTGLHRDRMLGLCLDDYVRDRCTLQAIPHALTSGKYQYLYQKHDQTQREVEACVSTIEINNRPLMHVIVHDITERMQAQRTLQQREAEYALIFNNAPVGIIHYDLQGIITRCNNEFVRILRSTSEQLLGLDMNTLADTRLVQAMRQSLAGVEDRYTGKYRAVTSGHESMVRVLFSPVRDSAGVQTGGIGITEEIR